MLTYAVLLMEEIETAIVEVTAMLPSFLSLTGLKLPAEQIT